MNKIFGAEYATVFIDEKNKKIKIIWKSFLTNAQFKIVLELVAEQVSKYKINTIAEDRTKMKFRHPEGLENWFLNYFLPKITSVERYIIKDFPASNGIGKFYQKSELRERHPNYIVLSSNQDFENELSASA